MQVYYEEDRRSAARMWERLIQQVRMAKLETGPGDGEKQDIGDIVMQEISAPAETQDSGPKRQEDAGQMASRSTEYRRISRRTLVASLGVGTIALGTAASYVFFSSRLVTPQSRSREGASTIPTPTTGTEPPASGKLGDILTTYRGQNLQVTDARWSPGGSLIATASADQTVQIWQAANGKMVFTYRGHNDKVNSVDWSPDGRFLVSGGGSIAVSSNHQTPLVNPGSQDYSVQIWNASSGLVRKLNGPTNFIRPIRWSPNGKYIAAACYDRKAYVWEASTGRLVHAYTGHKTILTGLAWSPDSKQLVTSDDSAQVQIWEATTGRRFLTYTGHQQNGLVLAVAWSPDGARIASSAGGAGSDAIVKVWNATNGQTLFTYQGHVLSALSAGFPGRSALSASLPFLPTHPASGSGIGVFAVAWSPDSTTVASGGGLGDGSVQIWKPATHERVFTFPSSNGGSYINTLAWSPGGAHIASASDNITTVWQSRA